MEQKDSRTEATVVTEDVFSGLIKPWGAVSARRLRTSQSVPTVLSVRVFLLPSFLHIAPINLRLPHSPIRPHADTPTPLSLRIGVVNPAMRRA
jgi:hypothetical protein